MGLIKAFKHIFYGFVYLLSELNFSYRLKGEVTNKYVAHKVYVDPIVDSGKLYCILFAS